MGNSSTAVKGLDPRFQQICLEQHQLLGNLLLVRDTKTQENFLIKQVNIASETDYNRLLKELKQRKTLSDKRIGKHLLKLKDIEGRQQSEICGKSFKLLLYLEPIQSNLKAIFTQRIQTSRCFQEEELVNIMRTVISGLISLHDNNFKNVHLCKQSVVVTGEKSYKMIDTQLCNCIHPYFEILNGVPPKTGTYLAPQLINEIKNGSFEFCHTPKADLFTLGVIVLELATLKNLDSYFDYDSKNINIFGLHKVINQLPMSRQFQNILHSMLEEHQQERIGLLSLKQLLSEGSRTQVNQQLFPYTSSTLINQKQSARTFISRSKKMSSRQRSQSSSQQVYQNSKNTFSQRPEQYLQINQFITQIPERPISVPSTANFNSQLQPQIKKQIIANYVPIQERIINSQRNINVERIPQSKGTSVNQPAVHIMPTFKLPTLQTPKSQVISSLNLPQIKDFDTPVSLLTQHQPVMRVSKVVLQSSQNNVQQQIFNQKKAQQSKEDVPIRDNREEVITRPELFNNKTYGKLSFSNGAHYQGQFNHKGKFEGNGILYYPNGKPCYSGSWKNNAFDGFGVLYNENPSANSEAETVYEQFDFSKTEWLYYQGEFSIDQKDGFGTLYIANGDKFSGCFKNDTIEGFGSFYRARDQKNINGIWINNVLKH